MYLPRNTGLERFNYLAIREFTNRPVLLVQQRGELIPFTVEEKGGYGWTGNDLYQDYLLNNPKSSLRLVRRFPWPEQCQPRLCLLGPEEDNPEFYYRDGFMLVAPTRYKNLVSTYLAQQSWTPLLYFLEGQVEREIRKNNADIAIDIVYSGRTIREEKLAIYATLFDAAGFVLITKDI